MADQSCLPVSCVKPLCWPLASVVDHSSQRSRQARTRQAVPPTPLLPRERTLSVDGSQGLRSNITRSDQSQSRLFSKLPKEIRLEIYEETLGGRVIHLGFETKDVIRANYLRHYYCSLGNDEQTLNHECRYPIVDRPKEPAENLLSLLLSCHRVCVCL